MAGNKKISELPAATLPIATGVKFEALQGGINVQVDSDDMPGGSITRELNRAWSAELLFDKNEIDTVPHTLTGDLVYTIAVGGNLVNQFSVIVQTIVFDGNQSLTFNGFNFIYGITNGDVPDAGTYQIFFMYRNGIATAQFTEPSLEEAGLTPLSPPANFAAVPGTDPETELDLTWDAVTSNSGYEIEYSTTGGGGPWIPLTTPSSVDVSYTHTGLTANTTYHYRIRALGDGVDFANSIYSIVAATTEDTGDVTPPTFTFSPVDTATDVGVNAQIIIVASEPVRDSDGVTEITNANAADYIVLKETNSGGADIAKTVTIDATKTTFTITPTTGYGGGQLVFVEISGVEDLNGNEAVADSITFTTSAYTTFNGTSNRLIFGDLLDGVFAADNAVFKLRATMRNLPLSGDRVIFGKWSPSDNHRSFLWYTNGSDIYFVWARVGTSVSRLIKWTGALEADEHDYELQYNGALDTNDGLDRCVLLKDGVTVGSKTLDASVGVLTGFFHNATANLAAGAGVNISGTVTYASYFSGQMKDLEVLSAGDVMELQIPVLIEGTDTSGNGRNGTWV